MLGSPPSAPSLLIKKTLLKIWRELPNMIQLLAVRLLRPRYRVAVAAIILDEEKRILLCEHTYRKFYPWGLPGGGLEYGESPECGIRREVWEETGYEVDVERLLSAESSREFHHVSLIYLCKIVGGSFVPNLETSQIKFFPMDDLPNLLYTEKILIERVAVQLSLQYLTMTNWLEVSLTVNGELAEAVADVLARFAYSGVMMEQGVKYTDAEDAGTPTGPITVRAYLEMDDRIEETRQKLEESLYYLGRIQPLPAVSYRQIADQNWMEAWKQHYKPITVGERLIILPAWMDSPDPSRVAIKIDPGMAFGTGTHPTTQLCLELLESAVTADRVSNSEHRVIDVGCGSGILSIAAIKLGARSALGVDIDAGSIENARANADTNAVGDELILGVGSVAEILKGRFAYRKAPLVIANILAPVIIRLFDAGLARLVEEGGALILSGILEEQAQAVIEAGEAQGLRLKERRQIRDWVALTMG